MKRRKKKLSKITLDLPVSNYLQLKELARLSSLTISQVVAVILAMEVMKRGK